MSTTKAILIGVVLCEALQMLASVIDIPREIYRLLCFRYVFLMFLALVWVRHGIHMNRRTWTLSMLSMASIIYFGYFLTNDEPLFYYTPNHCHRWPCYFYVAFLLCYVLDYI